MLLLVVEKARELGCSKVIAEYLKTTKNKPTLDFLIKSGMEQISNFVYVWDVSKQLSHPEHLHVNNNF
jgi:predicted enzyme involved in methoxymalonyl-ACP biosynthesis